MRCDWREALQRTRMLETLAAFDPHVAGTPPLGLDLPESDIDVLCHAPDPDRFCASVVEAFGAEDDFAIWQWSSNGRPIVASFTAAGWPFEIFGATDPVEQQSGWRHFTVGKRLLELGGDRFRTAVMAERRRGLKTEPAFASVLGLTGDAYEALLSLAGADDAELAELLGRR